MNLLTERNEVTEHERRECSFLENILSLFFKLFLNNCERMLLRIFCYEKIFITKNELALNFSFQSKFITLRIMIKIIS